MSSGDTVKDQVVAVLAEQAMLSPDEVRLDNSLEDLGIDSLGIVEAIFGIEETFDISVPFNANDPEGSEFDISSVGKIVQAVTGLVEAKTG